MLRRNALILFAACILIYSIAYAAQPSAGAISSGRAEDQLSLSLLTQQYISGYFVHDDISIQFYFGKLKDGTTAMTIKDREDKNLVSTIIKPPVSKNLPQLKPYSFRVGKKFQFSNDFKLDSSMKAVPVYKSIGNIDELLQFRKSPEYEALFYLSQSFGQLGITGNRYPITSVLHSMALNLMKQKEKKGFCGSVQTNCANCFGMCGDDCCCWKAVCGDCSCHEGCKYHDNLCSQCTYLDPFSWTGACVGCAIFAGGYPAIDCRGCDNCGYVEPGQQGSASCIDHKCKDPCKCNEYCDDGKCMRCICPGQWNP